MKPNQSTIQIRCPVCRQMDFYQIGAEPLICNCCGADLNSTQRPQKRTFPEPPPFRRQETPAWPQDAARGEALKQKCEKPDAWYKRGGLLQKTLAICRDSRTYVTIFTTNGVRLHGFIAGFDAECVALDSDGNTPLIMRSAISTILPKNVLKTAAAKET